MTQKEKNETFSDSHTKENGTVLLTVHLEEMETPNLKLV